MVQDICSSLEVPREEGVLLKHWKRDNLSIRVELLDGDDLKRERLCNLLSTYVCQLYWLCIPL